MFYTPGLNLLHGYARCLLLARDLHASGITKQIEHCEPVTYYRKLLEKHEKHGSEPQQQAPRMLVADADPLAESIAVLDGDLRSDDASGSDEGHLAAIGDAAGSGYANSSDSGISGISSISDPEYTGTVRTVLGFCQCLIECDCAQKDW